MTTAVFEPESRVKEVHIEGLVSRAQFKSSISALKGALLNGTCSQ